MRNANRAAAAFLFAAVALWGYLPVAIREADWHPLGLMWDRCLGGAIGLGLIVLFLGCSFMNLRWQLLTGVLYLNVNICWMLSSLNTSVANSLVLVYTAPLICLAAEWLYWGKPLAVRSVCSVLLGTSGLVLVIYEELNLRGLLGIFFGVLAAASYSAHLLTNRKLRAIIAAKCLSCEEAENRTIEQVRTGVFAGQFLGALAIPVVAVLFSIGPRSVESVEQGVSLMTVAVVWGASIVCYTAGSSVFSAYVTSTITMSEVIAAGVFAALFLGEVPPPLACLGGTLILFAAYFAVGDEESAAPGEPG